MKKKYGIIACMVIMSCFIFGCQKKEDTGVNSSQENQEYDGELYDVGIEGMENMTDEELNQELIRRADEQEVIPDKK